MGMALLATLMAVNFTACTNDEEPANPDSPKMLNVSLGCIGEILDVTEDPLGSRAAGNDLYAIQVYTYDEKTMEGVAAVPYTNEKPYAYGVFTSLEDVTIGLLEGYKYRFQASMVVDGQINGFYFYNNGYNKFTFSTSDYINNISSHCYGNQDIENDRYYGELDEYTPTENGNAEIYMKRVSYGAKYIAKDLSEGELNINVGSSSYNTDYSLILTPEVSEDDGIYTFRDILQAYRGVWQNTGYDPETGHPTGQFADSYTETKDITVSWTKADGEVTPLGTYQITFKRNKKTTITIKAEEITTSNGITVTMEETPMVDDDSYVIEGGQITVVPIVPAA